MLLSKYKITAANCGGFALVTYQDEHFKSVIAEFNPPLSDSQLGYILTYITDDPNLLKATFDQKFKGKVVVVPVFEHADQPEPAAAEYPVNEKIALWCRFYSENHKDENLQPIKYRTGASEAGKLKDVAATPAELTRLFEVYFKSDLWYLKPKSISNFVKKFNEIRALAFAKPVVKEHPLPYDEAYFNKLDMMGKRSYHAFLIKSGYRFEHNSVRGGKWVKEQTLNQ